MCGICGIINFNQKPVETKQIKCMMQKIKHRGPDDEGTFFESNVGLGFVRLSILDLTPLGHQPMFNLAPGLSINAENYSVKEANSILSRENDGRYVIVYNGEIYNYIEIREELKSKGFRFRSSTDTEVVLNSFIEWGETCLEKFNGMWAFAIYDREKKKLFCSRDRYGVKPFYYYADNEQFIFASEIPSILSILKRRLKPNNKAIFDYLVFNRTDQTGETFFEGIKKLQHSSILAVSSQPSAISIKRWYELRSRVSLAEPFNSAEEYRELFSSSVGLRLRSDVPVGVCLSGGLDSSSIVSVLLKDYNKKDLNTFSAIYGKNESGDESEYIDEFKSKPLSMHFTSPTLDSLMEDISLFVKAQAEPVPSTSPYAQFKVMELARNNVVVTLDGQGADESLAGYHYFFGFYFKDLLKRLRLIKLLNESSSYITNHKSIYGLRTGLYFMMPKSIRTNLRLKENSYLHQDFQDKYNTGSVIANDLYGSGSLNEALLNHFEYKLEHLLKWEDRNSMHFSLEARVPFLDYRLVERTLATGSDLIIKKGTTKQLLREAMNGTLPEKIKFRRDKIGFDTPQDKWFRQKRFVLLVLDHLNSKSFKGRNIINSDKAKELLKQHYAKEKNISKDIWKWINLELWFRDFID